MSERKPYSTRQRNAVLACFESQPQRVMTAQEVYEQLKEQGFGVGRTTVYRTVAKLCEEGALMAPADLHAPAKAPTRYQHRGDSRQHISVRCSMCGLVAALHCDAVNEFERHLFQDHGFLLQEAECLLPGLCGSCRKQSTSPQPKEKPQ